MSNQHVLKIHPAPLADLISGAKTAEVRRNDRDFQVGDTVHLMEVNPETGNWTGAADHVRTISHIQTGYGLPDGMCVLSYTPLFLPRNRLPGRLAIRAALPDVPGDMLDHGLFAALDAMAAPPAAAHGDEAVRDVLAERQRQVDVERFTLKNDDGYGWGALALAGGCYALHAHQTDELYGNAPKSWPWASHWWKPGTPRRNLVKAAALILAEIQRLDRAAMRAQGDGEAKA